MSISPRSKIIAACLVGIALVSTASESFAKNNKYMPERAYGHYYRHRGIGPGAAVAGAALGILGAATAGIAADRYYNGYPAYTYGPGYGGRYGYDYLGDRGYYGPY